MPRRIDAGEVLAAASAARWCSWRSSCAGSGVQRLGGVRVPRPGDRGAGGRSRSPPRWHPRRLELRALSPRAPAGGHSLFLAIVAVQLIEPPPAFSFAGAASPLTARPRDRRVARPGRRALVVLGGALRPASISVTVSVGGRDVRRRVPAVDRRPGAVAPSPTPPPAAVEPSAGARPGDAAVHPRFRRTGEPPPPFELLRFEATPVTPAVAVLELEGRLHRRGPDPARGCSWSPAAWPRETPALGRAARRGRRRSRCRWPPWATPVLFSLVPGRGPVIELPEPTDAEGTTTGSSPWPAPPTTCATGSARRPRRSNT